MSRAAEQFALLTWETKFILVLSGVGLVVTSILAIIARRTSSALVGVLAGLPLIVGWAYTAVVLARRLTVRPVAELTRDLKGFGRGEKPALLSRKAIPGVGQIIEGDRSSGWPGAVSSGVDRFRRFGSRRLGLGSKLGLRASETSPSGT